MSKQKTRPRIGDECWFVEWTYEMAWVDGDSTSESRKVDLDKCKTHTRKVSTKEEAERLAKEVYPQTMNCFGFVEYWHARYEAYDDDDGDGPYLPHWQTTEEYPEAYEGEG